MKLSMTVFELAFLANLMIAIAIILVTLGIRMFNRFLTKHFKSLVSLTVGTLLALIFIDFLPGLSEFMKPFDLGITLLSGLLFFYIIELFLHWHHCMDLNHMGCSHSFKSRHEDKGVLMFMGTLLHNLFHGVVIFSSFSVGTKVGLMLSVGILLHSLPQNIANFIMNKEKIWTSIVAAMGGVIGVLLCLPFEFVITKYQFYILAFMTGGLMYLALTDILPSVNEDQALYNRFKHLFFIGIGIIIIFVLNMLHFD